MGVFILWRAETHLLLQLLVTKMGSSRTGLVVLLLLGLARGERARVKYLGGITFLLRDRCPDTATQSQIAEYDNCVANARSLHTQCVTDKLRDNSKLTVPTFTDICSARCYTGNSQLPPNDCPYNGKRLDGRGTAGSNQVDKAVADRFLGYCIVLYCTVLYCTVLYCTVLYCTLLYCTVLCCTVHYCDVLYSTVLYSTVLYFTLRYCTVLYINAM